MKGPMAHDVLGLAQQQRAAALEVAQVDVIAQARAQGASGAVHRQHDLRFGVIPRGLGVDADIRAEPHRRHRLRLGEDFCIGANADFEILRPHLFPDQHILQARGFGRTGANRGEVVADHRDDRAPHRFGLAGIAARLFLDHALEHAGDESDAGRLDRLQVAGGEQPGGLWIALALGGIGEYRVERAQRRQARRGDNGRDRSLEFEEIAHGRRHAGQIVQRTAANDGEHRTAHFGRPDATDQHRLLVIHRQAGCRGKTGFHRGNLCFHTVGSANHGRQHRTLAHFAALPR
jgi:hypothetical protein